MAGGFFRGGKALAAEEERGKILFRLLSFLFPPCIMREADFLGRSNNGEKEGTFFGVFYRLRLRWCMGATPPSQAQTVRKRKRRAGMFDRISPSFLQPKVPSKVPRKFCKTFLIPIVLIPACQSEIYSVACLEPLSS